LAAALALAPAPARRPPRCSETLPVRTRTLPPGLVGCLEAARRPHRLRDLPPAACLVAELPRRRRQALPPPVSLAARPPPSQQRRASLALPRHRQHRRPLLQWVYSAAPLQRLELREPRAFSAKSLPRTRRAHPRSRCLPTSTRRPLPARHRSPMRRSRA
jgi:hypothetical protein